jgi:peptide/nickel transport system substrate-binding protein
MIRRILMASAAVAALCAVAPTALAQQRSVTLTREVDTDRYDPHRSTARSTAEVLFMTNDTLVALDYDLKTLHPGLAQSWTISPDGLTYTFKLRPGIKFCSGKTLTAADVVASYNRWLDPETKGVVLARMGQVDAITAPDESTVVYKLKQPFSELLFQMTQHFHVVINAEQAKQLGQDFGVKALDGTGPYCFESWTPRDQTVLVRNPHYQWGPAIYADPKPKVDRIVWKVVPEENTRVNSLKTAQSDATQYVPYWAVKELQADRRMTVAKAENYFWTYFIGFKIDRDLVSDLRVRRAMNLAVDQKGLTDAVTFGYGDAANSFLSPSVLDYNKSPKPEIYGENVAEANRLLDEAGWRRGADGMRTKDGKKLAPVFYGFTGFWKEIAEAVQGDLRKVGIDMQLQLFDATVAWGKLATQEYDAFGMSFPYVSAGDALNLYFRSAATPVPNRVNWKDPETDELLARGSSALDDKTRADAFGRVQTKVEEAAVWIPLYHEPLFLASGAKLKPMRAHGIYGAGLYKGLSLEFK